MAVVEFAPYQKIPPEKKKADPRMNTIEAGRKPRIIFYCAT
jgi:hypothetical protein